MNSAQLLEKYNIPVPRYTSYPTVPHWDNRINVEQWFNSVKRTQLNNAEEGISLYIHLPFCDSLCTYCGCTKHITRNHALEYPYVDAVLKEWDIYLSVFKERPIIRELHLGGGTPTFFSPKELKRLVEGVFKNAKRHKSFEGSFEGHPNNTTFEHLQTLFDLGFRRVSYGIQDFDLKVQEAIHRIQPFENVKNATQWAREIGYTSVNFDLIYGLPYQTKETMKATFELSIGLRPDRIAFYNYAHVPSLFPSQKYYEHYLPNEIKKQEINNLGKDLLAKAGYKDIGMDHFTLPQDDLFLAQQRGALHRNFMGYTIHKTKLLIGLGASAISDAYGAYHQNEKNVKQYQVEINEGKFPHIKGHLLSKQDQERRRMILDIACKSQVNWSKSDFFSFNGDIIEKLEEMSREGLLYYNLEGLIVKDLGKPFIRNICSVFDAYLVNSKTENFEIFSKAI